MIVLLEPPRPAGFWSGGYRYQYEIGRRLAQRGRGRVQVVPPEYLDAALAALRQQHPDLVAVVDGLFAQQLRGPLPDGVVALLHMVPAEGWARSPLPVIATGADTAAAVRSRARSTAVVRPGLDACFQPPRTRTARSRLRAVAVGTVCAGKGQERIARALAASSVPCDLVLFGDLRIEPDYVARVRAAAGPVQVTFAGVRPAHELPAEVGDADLWISASRRESFGMAAAEACACGTPVFAFAAGEIPAFVRDGDNGWLVPCDASDEQFAARLGDVLRAPQRLEAARQRAVRPPLADWDEVTRRFEAACAAAVS